MPTYKPKNVTVEAHQVDSLSKKTADEIDSWLSDRNADYHQHRDGMFTVVVSDGPVTADDASPDERGGVEVERDPADV